MDGVAYLVRKIEDGEDRLGQPIMKEDTREIFVSSSSVNRNEFFSASKSGLTPEVVLITAAVNYSGEKSIIYEDVRYSIYRTFHNRDDDQIELYLNRKASDVIN